MMLNSVLRVNLFGGLQIFYGDKEVKLDRNTGSKTTQMFLLLLMHLKTGISKTEMMEALYGRETVENKNASLNNTSYRLRKQLCQIGLPAGTCFSVQKGMCAWNKQLPVETDVMKFDAAVRRSCESEAEEDRTAFLEEAFWIYKGEVLPDMIGEEWIAVMNMQYHDKYQKYMKLLFEGMQNSGQYEKLYQASKTAAGIYPLDGWQLWQINALTAMQRHQEAMEICEQTSRLYFDELDISPSPEMLETVKKIRSKVSDAVGTIEGIQRKLTEREMQASAYYCSLPGFVDAYRVTARTMGRNGVSAYLVLCTLKYRKELLDVRKKYHAGAAELFVRSVGCSLRKGDVYTKYNEVQYLILLSGITREACSIVSARIDNEFHRHNRKRDYRIEFYFASVAETVLPLE